MPTKRKTTKKKSYRKVGAAKGGMKAVAMKLGGMAVAVYGAGFLKKTFTSLSPTVFGGGEIALGVMLPRFIGKGNKLVEGVGDGLTVKGLIDLLSGLGVVTGVGKVPYINPYLAPPLITPKPGGKLSRPIGGVPSELVKLGALISN